MIVGALMALICAAAGLIVWWSQANLAGLVLAIIFGLVAGDMLLFEWRLRRMRRAAQLEELHRRSLEARPGCPFGGCVLPSTCEERCSVESSVRVSFCPPHDYHTMYYGRVAICRTCGDMQDLR